MSKFNLEKIFTNPDIGNYRVEEADGGPEWCQDTLEEALSDWQEETFYFDIYSLLKGVELTIYGCGKELVPDEQWGEVYPGIEQKKVKLVLRLEVLPESSDD